MRRSRRLAVRLHLWGGLLTGPLILVLGLSGTALVFRAELDAAVNGTSAVVSRRPIGGSSLDRVVQAARTYYPTTDATALYIPGDPGQPYRVELRSGRRRLDAAVDPESLRVIEGRAPERSVLLAVHSLHVALHAGRMGALIVGVLGGWLVIESLTGLWLCWPLVNRAHHAVVPRRPPTPGRLGVVNRALHRMIGALSVALGVIIALTGAVLALGSAFAVTRASATDAATSTYALTRLDTVAARALATLPGARVTAIVGERGRMRVETRARSADGVERRASVIIDRDGETVLAVRTDPPGIDAWQLVRRLHYGDFAGWLSRLAWALVGLSLPVLSITGYVLSSRRAA